MSEVAATLGGVAFGLLGLIYLLNLLSLVVRGVGITVGVAVVKVVLIVLLGAISWALLGVGGMLR